MEGEGNFFIFSPSFFLIPRFFVFLSFLLFLLRIREIGQGRNTRVKYAVKKKKKKRKKKGEKGEGEGTCVKGSKHKTTPRVNICIDVGKLITRQNLQNISDTKDRPTLQHQ
eukprot:TRINITY_DN10066_c0_g1_i1.p1 TRINITY_DN10066_c0_g1~~TRINITY_DN10066_c0_g1_i1.p1  ORF type:complete len:111 (-),score=7.74 TRINITY_DN10066_c0_g1_i1:120-452(-)